MKKLQLGFLGFLNALVTLLRSLGKLRGAARRFLTGLCRLCRPLPANRGGGCCVDVPLTEYRRPDPLIYCQTYLMKNGLAVTWDNPDIQILRSGEPVSSSSLEPDTEYEVVARVWNNSYDAPAIGLPVTLSFLSFGIEMTSTFVGRTFVDLGAKGTSQCPAFAKFRWRTPTAAGHYCLQARLDWEDDANPDNNLGQENTHVGELHSPAVFSFGLRNDAGVQRRIRLEADMYRLLPRPPCPEQKTFRRPESRLAESRARWEVARKEHAAGSVPVSGDWKVQISPAELTMAPWEERQIEVSIEPARAPIHGRQAFNVNGYAEEPAGGRQLVGGVTLFVEG